MPSERLTLAVKDDELAFARIIYLYQAGAGSVRDVVEAVNIPNKRCWYLLDKWAGRGLYDYGVAVDLGWFTPAGIAWVESRLEKQESVT